MRSPLEILVEAERETADEQAKDIIRSGITRLKMMIEVEKIDHLLEDINKEKRHADKWYSVPGTQQWSRGATTKHTAV